MPTFDQQRLPLGRICGITSVGATHLEPRYTLHSLPASRTFRPRRAGAVRQPARIEHKASWLNFACCLSKPGPAKGSLLSTKICGTCHDVGHPGTCLGQSMRQGAIPMRTVHGTKMEQVVEKKSSTLLQRSIAWPLGGWKSADTPQALSANVGLIIGGASCRHAKATL